VLIRQDLVSPSRQDKNAGNSGDLVKHTFYVALLDHFADRGIKPRVVEAHGGKGVYASANPHLRRARGAPGYAESAVGRTQASCFAPPPSGLGPVSGLEKGEIGYAGSGALHAMAVADGRADSLELLDADAGVRAISSRLFSEQCFARVRNNLRTTDPGGFSEPVMLSRCRARAFAPATVLHLDPFAFVMAAEDSGIRALYRDLICECDARIQREELAAATVFFTWGSNSAAAKADLFGRGFGGGLLNGYQELVSAARSEQRIVITWCWEYYFALLCIVPAAQRDAIARQALAEMIWLAPLMRVLKVD
jgi:hypothetical protein